MATVFSSKLFSYSKKLKLMATDASVLSHSADRVWDRIYPDSADQGFEVRSEETGAIAVFGVDYVDTSGGEIQGWNMKPTPETVRRMPHLAGVKLLVVNT